MGWEKLNKFYHKDTEPLYHSFKYSCVSLFYGIYPLPAMHSLLVTYQLLTIYHRVHITYFNLSEKALYSMYSLRVKLIYYLRYNYVKFVKLPFSLVK